MSAATFRLGLAVATGLTLTLAAAEARAQTWGQPAYVPAPAIQPYASRAYGATGRLATGYSTYGYVVVPTQPYAYGGYGYDRGGRYGWSAPYRSGYAYGRSYGYPRYDSGRRPGYRDWYGYNDDRPYSRWSRGRSCNCDAGYLYDR